MGSEASEGGCCQGKECFCILRNESSFKIIFSNNLYAVNNYKMIVSLAGSQGVALPPSRMHIASPAFHTFPPLKPIPPRNRGTFRVQSSSTLPKSPQELQLHTDIPIAVQSVAVGDQSISIIVADCDAVMQMYIDAGQGDRDPYWTCIWPSSILMAQEVLRRPELVAGKRVADLGCGLGLGGVAAALAGASEVVFLDREPLSLQCSLLNAILCGQKAVLDPETAAVAATLASQGGDQAHAESLQCLTNASIEPQPGDIPHVRAELFDWNHPNASLLGYFDVVLACDVLYEAFSVEPVAAVAPKLLKQSVSLGGGGVLLADPPLRAKQNRERFLELIGRDGYTAAEWGQREARVWEESDQEYREVPIEFMILKKGCDGDTVGVKFYKD